jgi:predicted O-linked N-acetylglucosamine transferase (SPINDLY family)
LCELGREHCVRGRLSEAEACFRRAIRRDPVQPEAVRLLGWTLVQAGHFRAGIAHYRRALKLNKNDAAVCNNIAGAYLRIGDFQHAREYYLRAVAIDPRQWIFRCNLLLAHNFDLKISPQRLLEEHRKWAVLPEPRQIHSPSRPLPRRSILRVGYVLGGFSALPVASFLEAILENHDRRVVATTLYLNLGRVDETSERLRKIPPQVRDLASLGDEEAARQIRSDRIDILVDLSGHSGGNRLPLFGRRPAPVQVTYLGYPNTTGMDCLDYRITDSLSDPPGRSDHLYTERLLRLDPCFLCYRAPRESPPLSVLPALRNGFVTFGCLGQRPKINAAVLATWVEVLRHSPRSRLLLKCEAFRDPLEIRRLKSFFYDRGVAPNRLDFRAPVPTMRDHLLTYREVDMALDTFPYCGTTGTCEALWNGVPVVTLVGQTHRSRTGMTILHQIGLGRWCARDRDEYVRLACAAAEGVPELAMNRRTMRKRMRRSPLCDGPGMARRLEHAYHELWKGA